MSSLRIGDMLSRPKICQFCVDKNILIDYKQVDMLRRFVTEEGKIRPRRQTGTCAKHQRDPGRRHQTRPPPGIPALRRRRTGLISPRLTGGHGLTPSPCPFLFD